MLFCTQELLKSLLQEALRRVLPQLHRGRQWVFDTNGFPLALLEQTIIKVLPAPPILWVASGA